MDDQALQEWVRHARQVHDNLRAEMRRRFARDLPLEELIFDRWERARSLGFGDGASIYHSSYVYGDVAVGANTWVGPQTLLDGSGGLKIGAHCNISAGVQIYTHDTVRRTLSAGTLPIDREPVSIGDCCYIGSNTVIAKGVTIGPYCVVGACSFVNRDLAAYTVAAGIPCRTIGEVVIEGNDVRIVYPRVS
jgi:acetyltransferase-like isoleucine patch superfamily enzyme